MTVCVLLCRWLSATFPSMQLASICLKHPGRILLSHLAGRGRKSWNAEYSDSYWGQSWNWDPRKKEHVSRQLWWWRGLSNGSWIISDSLKTLKRALVIGEKKPALFTCCEPHLWWPVSATSVVSGTYSRVLLASCTTCSRDILAAIQSM